MADFFDSHMAMPKLLVAHQGLTRNFKKYSLKEIGHRCKINFKIILQFYNLPDKISTKFCNFVILFFLKS